MPYSQYLQKSMLDSYFKGATPTVPTSYSLGLSTGVPNSTSASELTPGSLNVTRQNLGTGSAGGAWLAASTVAGSAFVTNNTAVTFASLSAGSFSGCQVWDTNSTTGGNMLVAGGLAAARITSAGDSLVGAPGAFTVALA